MNKASDKVASAFPFDLYAKDIFRKAGVEDKEGINIGGSVINNTTLIPASAEGIKNLLKSIKQESAKMGLLLNTKKTKILTTATTNSETFNVKGDELEIVKDFNLLGSMVTSEATSSPEIRRTIAMAKSTMKLLNKVFKWKKVSKGTKIRLIHSLVFSVFT